MPDINGIPYVESSDLVSAYPAASQALAQELSDQLASKLPYSYGTATPSTTTDGFLWYDENDTPPTPKFWDGAAFQALTSGKILQVVRDTDVTDRSTTSSSFVDVTGMSVTITPTKSDSVIILVASVGGSLNAEGTATISITDNSNNGISGGEVRMAVIGSSLLIIPFTAIAYATPATTSAVTYKLRFRTNAGTFTLQNANNPGQLYAIEVAA